MDQIFCVPIHMATEWNEEEKLNKVNKKLGEMTKVFQDFRNPKKGGQKHFFKKAHNTLENYK